MGRLGLQMKKETIMVAPRTGLFKAVCLSAALLGAVSAVITLGLAEPVQAAGGNGNGNAGGNGKGNGNSGESRGGSEKGAASSGDRAGGQGAAGASAKAAGNSGARGGEGGTSFSGSADREDKQPSSKVKAENDKTRASAGKGNKLARELGVHPSELGALNAANASNVALSRASATSRVGRIAAYRDAVLDGQLVQSDYNDALEALQAFDGEYRDRNAIEQQIADLEKQIAALEQPLPQTDEDVVETQEEVVATEEDVVEAEPEPPTTEQQIAGLEQQIADLNAELEEATRYEQAVALEAELGEQLEAQSDLERSLLKAAANKPVTDEVEAAVQSLLGID
jgi:predicted  nucleic acid-binding Zn-ribbon protein